MKKPIIDGSTVVYNEQRIEFRYSVLDVCISKKGILGEKRIVVLLDPDAYIGIEERCYKNLFGFDLCGNEIWRADFPQNYKGDYYWKIEKRWPLKVNSFSSYECTIDVDTGKVIKKKFYK